MNKYKIARKENLKINVVYPDNKDLMALINELYEELLTRYPKEGIFTLDFNQPIL